MELGCGYGENCSYFIEQGACYVLGTDLSSNMIELAKKKNNAEKIEYKILAMEDINQLNEKFDLIVSSLAVHYVEDFEKLLNDVSNLLVDGGYFIFSQEHPIETATILNQECDGKDDITIGNKNYYLVSDYNRNGKRVTKWYHQDVIKYHRNFSYIINAILKSDLQLEECLEPLPTEEMLKMKPKYQNQFDRPYFLFLKLRKKKKE